MSIPFAMMIILWTVVTYSPRFSLPRLPAYGGLWFTILNVRNSRTETFGKLSMKYLSARSGKVLNLHSPNAWLINSIDIVCGKKETMFCIGIQVL